MMKRKYLALINTLLLVVSLAVNLSPLPLQAATTTVIPPATLADTPANVEIDIAESVPDLAVETEQPTTLIPHRLVDDNPSAAAPPAIPLGVNENLSCLARAFVVAYRAASPGVLAPDPLQFPTTRPSQNRGDPNENPPSTVGYDYYWVNPPGTTITYPRPGAGGANNGWTAFPGTLPNAALWEQFDGAAASSLQELRFDPTVNHTVIRGETIQVAVIIRNTSARDSNCTDGTNTGPGDAGSAGTAGSAPAVTANTPGGTLPAIPQYKGQNIIFNSISLRMWDQASRAAASPLQTLPITAAQFYNTYDGQLLNSVTYNNILPRRANASGETEHRNAGDFIAILDVTVPETIAGYLEFDVANFTYFCTDVTGSIANSSDCLAAVGGPYNGQFIVDDTNEQLFTYYVSTIGGPWLYRDGETNAGGYSGVGDPYNPYIGYNPFRVIDIIGGQNGRQAGENAWFVVEVKNKWGAADANGTDSRSIQQVTQASGTPLTVCTAGNSDIGGTGQGWYSSLIIDPILGPQAGSVALTDNDLQIGGGESAFCAIRLPLTPDVNGDFTLNSVLTAESYPGGANEPNALSTDFDVDMTFPIATAELMVEKRIIEPLDAITGEPEKVRPGDIVRYEIVLTNISGGTIKLDTLSFIDSLTGPYVWDATGVVLNAADPNDPTNCPTAPCSTTPVIVQHTVTNADPNPIFNTITARAEIQGTTVEVTAQDTASILKIVNELGLNLSVRGNVNTNPILGQDTQLIYTLTYSNDSDFTMSQIEFIAIPNPIFGGPTHYPSLQNTPTDITTYLPDYAADHQAKVYDTNPPGGTPTLIYPRPGNPFPKGQTFGPIEWTVDLPVAPADVIARSPYVQQVVMDATLDDASSTVTRTNAVLVTTIENNDIDMAVDRWNTVTNQPIPPSENTVLRGETLSFDLDVMVDHPTDPLGACNAYVSMYTLDPNTGTETLVNPDIQFDWAAPGTPNVFPDAVTLTQSTNTQRPTYTVSDSAPNPLIFIFEVDARENCGGGTTDQLLERVVLQYNVSNIKIDTNLLIVTDAPNSTTEVTQGVYPLTGLGDQSYQILYRATNRGPVNVGIKDWGYCIVNSPIPTEDCTNGYVSMFDGLEGAPPYPDFGVAQTDTQITSPTRLFTTFPPRLDRRIFTLQEGQNYPNPIIIQMILEVSDTSELSNITTIRTFKSLPLGGTEVDFSVNAGNRTTIVRGDHDVPVQFNITNVSGIEIDDLRVLDLTHLVSVGQVDNIPPSVPFSTPFGAGPFAQCEFGAAGSGTYEIDNWANGSSASGYCLFDFVDEVIAENNRVEFLALVLGTTDDLPNPPRQVFSLALVTFTIRPHMVLDKTGSASVLDDQPIDYSITITNNSLQQWVEFDPAVSPPFSDTLSPAPDTSNPFTTSGFCIVAGNPAIPAGEMCGGAPGYVSQIEYRHFAGLNDVGGGVFRLLKSSSELFLNTASLSYRLVPPTAGVHTASEYRNTAVSTGERQYDPNQTNEAGEILVSAFDTHRVRMDCPLEWTMTFLPAGAPFGTDTIFTVGEEVTVTIQGRNYGSQPVLFSAFRDPQYVRDVDGAGGLTGTTFRDVMTWPHDSNNAIPDYTLPAFDSASGIAPALSYTFNVRIRLEDIIEIINETTFVAGLLDWALEYNTDLTPRPGCASSLGNENAPNSVTFAFSIRHPFDPAKYVESAPIVFTEGQTVDYGYDALNVSENVTLNVDRIEESVLFGSSPNNRLLIIYPGQGSASVNGSLGVLNPANPFDPAVNFIENSDITGTVGDPANNNLSYDYVKNDLTKFPNTGLDSDELINRMTAYVTLNVGGHPWLTPGVDDAELGVWTEARVIVENPLVVTETVLSPTTGSVDQPGVIQYFVTVTNISDEFVVTDIELDNTYSGSGSFVVPICDGVGGYTLADLVTQPNICLVVDSPPDPRFMLVPGQSKQVLVSFQVTPTMSDAEIVTTSRAKNGIITIDGMPYPLEDALSDENTVLVNRPLLSLRHQFYDDAACTQPLVLVNSPERDFNNDGVPEQDRGGAVYYGFELYANGGRTFNNVVLDVNILTTSDPRLTDAANKALLELALAATNPLVTEVGGVVYIQDSPILLPDQSDTGLICAPIVGDPTFTIPNTGPDPMIFQTTVNANDAGNGQFTSFVTKDLPMPNPADTNPPFAVGAPLDHNLVLDVSNQFVFIQKTVQPSAAFPGETVEYVISITNKTTNKTIYVNDVWDSNIGVGQQFYDHDSNPFTPDIPLEYHVDPLQRTSIPFAEHVNDPPLGLGWDWGTIGEIPPLATVTYTYQRGISEVDPNPLYNDAGMIGFIIDTPTNTVVTDSTRNALLISNSQLSVVKTAIPTQTVLGNSILYEITITNIGDEPVYDIIVWDDRYNLQYANTGPIDLLPNNPNNDPLLPIAILGGWFDPNPTLGNDVAKMDLAARTSNDPNSVTITYNLPTPPACISWTPAQPNEPFVLPAGTPYTGSVCGNTYDDVSELPLIDPFVNTAFAVGYIDDGFGGLRPIDNIGFDRAVVDLINPAINIQKIPSVNVAAIGTDVDYTIRIINTGNAPLRIDQVVDVPGSNIPPGNAITPDLPLDELTFENCPASGFSISDSSTNLLGTILRPFSTSAGISVNTTTIQVNNTAVLPPGCAASAVVRLQIPNPQGNNEYVNVAQVSGIDLNTAAQVGDLTSATVQLTASGLNVVKRAWNCDTASNGHQTPTLNIGGGQICTLITGNAGAQQISDRSEGQTLYYEISIINSGTDSMNQLFITDTPLVNLGNGLQPLASGLPTGDTWTDRNGNVYTWNNGQLIVGVQGGIGYVGYQGGTCNGGVDADADPLTGDDTYNCPTYQNYFGYDQGPFGADDILTPDDDSYIFQPTERFERPDPGPISIPVITYPHLVRFPDDDLDDDRLYVNQVRVIGNNYNPVLNDTTAIATQQITINPATVDLDVEACVDDNNNGTYDPDEALPCVRVARPGQDVHYRINITSTALVELENIVITDTVHGGTIPFSPSCFGTWTGGTPGVLPPGGTTTCTYLRSAVVPTPPLLDVTNHPYVNRVTVTFDIDPVTSAPFPGTPVSADAVISIAESELLLTIPTCAGLQYAPGGANRVFDVVVENIDPVNSIDNITVYIPEPPGTQNIASLLATTTQTLSGALNVTVPIFGSPITSYQVVAVGYLQDGSPAPGTLISSSVTCEIQRVDGDIVVTKSVLNPLTGSNIAAPGDVVEYTFTVRNLTNAPPQPILQFNISDPLLQGAGALEKGTGLSWNDAWGLNAPNPTLGAGAIISKTFLYTVAAGVDPIINTVTVSGLVGGVTPVSNVSQADLTIATGDLVVTANALPNPVIAGNSVVFTYRVCNTSNIPTPVTYNITTLNDGDPSGTPLVNTLGDPFVAGPAGLQLDAQECAYYTRTVPTNNPADIGSIITRGIYVEGCPAVQPLPCPAGQTVSDSQLVSVNVIGQPDPNGIINVTLTANRFGAAIGDVITYTVTVSNLNTVHPAYIEINGLSSDLGIFNSTTPLPPANPLHSFTIAPLGTTSQSANYTYTGTVDPLVESITINYTINGVNGSFPATLSLPVTTVLGSRLLIEATALENQSTPGGTITYQYRAINISNDPVTDAYLHDLTYIPALTPNGSPTVIHASCNPLPGNNAWGLGVPNSATSASNFIPTIPPNGGSVTGQIRCTVHPNFRLDPPQNLLHRVSINKDSIDASTTLINDVQDTDSVVTPIVPPLDITVTPPAVAVPGGLATFTFTVQNIGPADVNNAVLNAPVPAECPGGWVNQVSADGLWGGFVTVPFGATYTATAQCLIPPDFLTLLGVPSATFDYSTLADPVTITITGNVLDTAPTVQVTVFDPVSFQFIPPSNNTTLAYLRAGDTVPLTFVLANILPAGGITGLNYTITLNGSTTVCSAGNTLVVPSFGGTFNGDLPNPNDSVTIICNYTVQAGDAGTLVFSAYHMVNGTPIPIPTIITPPIDAEVESLGLFVSLTSPTNLTQETLNDGDSRNLTLFIENRGDVPLSNFTFSASVLDQLTGQTQSGSLPSNATSIQSLYAAQCPPVLLPGANCAITGMTFAVDSSDPQRFSMQVSVTGTTNTGSGFQINSIGTWQGTVNRPRIVLPTGASNCTTLAGGVCTTDGNVISYSPASPIVNQEITFTVTIRNTGSVEVSGASFNGTITAPASSRIPGYALTSAQAQATTLNFNIPAVIPANGAVTGTATFTPTVAGTHTLNWTFAATTPAALPNINSTGAFPFDVSQDPATAGLSNTATEPTITKSASVSSAFPGEPVIWTIVITNPSVNQMASVSLTDAVPGDLVINSATTSAGASIVTGNLVDITTGPLTPGQSVTVSLSTTISQTAPVPGTITNVACGARTGGTQVCAEATVTLGPGGTLPAAGIGSIQSVVPTPTAAERLPFVLAIFGMLFGILSVSMTSRQRLLLGVMALVIMALLIGVVLILAGGEDQAPAQSDLDGQPPVVVGEGFPTATPIDPAQPTATATVPPTVAPDALATIQSFPATATPYIVPTAAGPRRLDIPSLSYTLPVPIVELPQVNGEWDVSNLGHNIGWLDNTTWLDPAWGNTVLTAHIQLSDIDPGPFHQLHRLAPGDEILILEGAKISKFVVEEIFTVGPTENEVTHPTLEPMLTLITCTNWNADRGVFSDRLVVRARPII